MSFFSRQTRRPASPKLRTARPRLESLEERQLLSGFGPADGAYFIEPWSDAYRAVQIQATDQKIVVAGSTSVSPSTFTVARYSSAGVLDTTYGSGGLATLPSGFGVQNPYALVLQPDGKAVVAGEGLSITDRAPGVARLNTDGTPDTSFGNGGWNTINVQGNSTGRASGVALQSNGNIVISGNDTTQVSTYSYLNKALVAGFTAGGAVNSGIGGFGQKVQGTPVGYSLDTFARSATNSFSGLATQQDNRVIAVGVEYAGGDNTQRLVVARYTAAGVLDKTFNGNGCNIFLPAGISYTGGSSVAIQGDGKIVVAGNCQGTSDGWDMLVARFNSNGTIDTTFGGGTGYARLDVDGNVKSTAEVARGVVIQPDGKIVVGGLVSGWQTPSLFSSPGSVFVARLNSNGTFDGSFATGGFKIAAQPSDQSLDARGVALEADGSIIVAGGVILATDNSHHPFLMRFFRDSSPISPMKAAGSPAVASSGAKPPTLAPMQPVLTEAVSRSQATGADVSGPGSLDVRIASLPDATLDNASGSTISLDSDAVGWDRFVGRWTRRGRVPQAIRTGLPSGLTTR